MTWKKVTVCKREVLGLGIPDSPALSEAMVTGSRCVCLPHPTAWSHPGPFWTRHTAPPAFSSGAIRKQQSFPGSLDPKFRWLIALSPSKQKHHLPLKPNLAHISNLKLLPDPSVLFMPVYTLTYCLYMQFPQRQLPCPSPSRPLEN